MIINIKIQNKTLGGVKVVAQRSFKVELKLAELGGKRTGDKLNEEGGENNEQISNAEIKRGECSISALNRNEKGRKETCLGNTKRAKKRSLYETAANKEHGVEEEIGKEQRKGRGEKIESINGNEMDKKEVDARTRVSKAVRVQEGRISSRGFYRRTKFGNRNCGYNVRKVDKGFHNMLEVRPSSLFILLGELQLNRFHDKSVHIAGYSREDLDVWEFYETVIVEPMFSCSQLVRMFNSLVTVVLFYPGLLLLLERGAGIRPDG